MDATATREEWRAETGRGSWGGPLPPAVYAGKTCIATVDDGTHLYTADGDRDEAAEVARDEGRAVLMAAAPALLEACETALHELLHGLPVDIGHCADTLQAAVAKAKGGAP